MTRPLADMIAVLDGLNPSASGGANYSGGSDWFPGAPVYPSSEGLAAGYMVETVRRNPSASIGGNNSGGSNWFPGAPTYPSSEGLAGGCVARNPATGDCAAFRGTGMRGVDHSDPFAEYARTSEYDPNTPGDSYDAYLQAFNQSSYDVQRVRNPSASGGANYSGGSDWFPGSPTSISSEGLASVRRRAALLGALGAGASPARAVELAKVAQFRYNAPGACGQAYQTAYAAIRAMGYDHAWADQGARRVASRCNAERWAGTATKS